jgi:cytochrome c
MLKQFIAQEIHRQGIVLTALICFAASLAMSEAAQAQTAAAAKKPAASAAKAGTGNMEVATDMATIERGKQAYEARCGACHSVQDNRVGPAHQGVFGRKAGSAKDYEYSSAVANSKIIWNKATLQAWLTNPEALIPGQKMGYSLGSEAQRSDIIAFLASVSKPMSK